MVKLILGDQGTGKTKQIIDMVNTATASDKGQVVCIAKGDKLKFDISSHARLVDMTGYAVDDYKSLLGFISGMHAGNFDISQVFIDSLHKLVSDHSIEGEENFLEALDNFSNTHSVSFTVAVSANADNVSEKLKRYL